MDLLSSDELIVAVESYLIKCRSRCIDDAGAAHPSHSLVDRLDYQPIGSLVTIASLHGIPTGGLRDPQVLDSLLRHFATGQCTLSQLGIPSLGCVSVYSQIFSLYQPPPLKKEDLLLAMEMRLLTRLMPSFSRNVLRRILDLHNVKYAATDGVASLRKTLRGYLKRLNGGKAVPGDNALQMRRKHRADARARESVRLKEEWPQLVSDDMKRFLNKNFADCVSSVGLGCFTCGCCGEHVNLRHKARNSFDDFDLRLLTREDILCSGDERNDADDAEADSRELGDGQFVDLDADSAASLDGDRDSGSLVGDDNGMDFRGSSEYLQCSLSPVDLTVPGSVDGIGMYSPVLDGMRAPYDNDTPSPVLPPRDFAFQWPNNADFVEGGLSPTYSFPGANSDGPRTPYDHLDSPDDPYPVLDGMRTPYDNDTPSPTLPPHDFAFQWPDNDDSVEGGLSLTYSFPGAHSDGLRTPYDHLDSPDAARSPVGIRGISPAAFSDAENPTYTFDDFVASTGDCPPPPRPWLDAELPPPPSHLHLCPSLMVLILR
ncbi:hypothetical protein C8J57DRAFT_1255326 [Mycena rebaudengoi]|nr:hypothetical protein C8J57DRAFT_1255326 [Mycena rebaudengoi]